MLDTNKVLNVLKNNSCCVLATADSSGKSEAAVMVHIYKDDLSLIMCTMAETRKFKNISVNNQVSVVVGGFNNDPSVQMDGKARIMSDSEKAEAMAYVLDQKPEMKDYGIEAESFIVVTPTWIRYIDYSQEPNVEELSL